MLDRPRKVRIAREPAVVRNAVLAFRGSAIGSAVLIANHMKDAPAQKVTKRRTMTPQFCGLSSRGERDLEVETPPAPDALEIATDHARRIGMIECCEREREAARQRKTVQPSVHSGTSGSGSIAPE